MTGPRILIVEDEIIIATSLADRLRELDYEVLAVVPTGEEAVACATELRPDAVLMDIKLYGGEMDGVAAAAEIRAMHDVPVIYLTGYADETTLQRAQITDPFGYVLKPFDLRELRVTLALALYKHAAERRLRDSERQYRTLVEGSLQAILIVAGLPPRIQFANQRAAEMTGYRLEELLALSTNEIFDLVHEQDRAPLLNHLAAHLAGEEVPETGEFRLLRRDGAVRWIRYFARIAEQGGEPSIQGTFIDVTEGRQTQAEMERRVGERTTELAAVNLRLQQEVAERQIVQERLARYADELRILHRLSHLAGARLTADEVLAAGFAEIAASLAPDMAMLYILGDNSLHLRAHYPADPGVAARLPARKRAGECLCGLVVSSRQAQYSSNIHRDPRCTLPECKNAGMISFAGLPLHQGTEVLGILGLASAREQDFQERADFLEAVAAELANGLQNARLYEQVQDHVAGLEETVSQRTHELQAERDRTRAILEALGESVVVVDREGRILYVNPATVGLTGYGREETVGRQVDIWSGEMPGGPAEVQARLQAGQPWRGEMMCRRKDGTAYEAAVTVAPLFGPEDPGRPIASVWVQRDITPLREADRLKDQFVSNVSHELRTPLSIMTLTGDNLDTYYDQLPDPTRRKMVRELREQAHILGDLIGDVLEISRIDSGRLSNERRPLDLAALLAGEVERQYPLAAKKSLAVQVAGLKSLEVLGHDGQLRQAIGNLLNNAIKYTGEGGQVSCRCLVEVRAGSRWATVRIADNGIGIEPADLPRVFERFYRVSAQSNTPGTGLGLPIARELVERHGGHIVATSSPGEGSVFVIYLPLPPEEKAP